MHLRRFADVTDNLVGIGLVVIHGWMGWDGWDGWDNCIKDSHLKAFLKMGSM